jgi:serine phosphatase RsbU (regulator of sigma subunit)
MRLFCALILLLLACWHKLSSGQVADRQQKEDSLHTVITTSDDDTLICNAYKSLAALYIYSNPDTVLFMMDKSMAISKSLIKKHQPNSLMHGAGMQYTSVAYIMKAIGFQLKTNYPGSLHAYQQAEKFNDPLHEHPSNWLKTWAYKNSTTIDANLGALYKVLEEYDKSKAYIFRTLKHKHKIGDLEGVASSMANLGALYRHLNMLDSATYCFRYVLSMDSTKIKGSNIASAYLNLGVDFRNTEEFDSAIYYNELAAKIYEQRGETSMLSAAILNIGGAYAHLEQFEIAEDYVLRGIELAEKAKAVMWQASGNESLAGIYRGQGKFEKALYHFQLSIEFKDSLRNEERTREIARLEVQAEYDKKAVADSIDHHVELATAEAALQISDQRLRTETAEREKEKTVRYSLYGGLGLILVFALFIFNRFQVTRKQKQIIEEQKHKVDEKNKDITDSINYAQRIQEAMLPLEANIHKAFADSFVLYKPRDIVSGDFYWFKNFGDAIAVSVADCTGHGVPGAFMSMMGAELLNQVISDPAVQTPAHALQLIDERITQQLNKEGREQRQDGMDMVLCVFQPQKKLMQFCGANNPLLMIRNNELTQIKPNKQGVGGAKSDTRPFEFQEIQTQLGDCFYMFSDGYQDQFGGPKGKKFMRKRMHQLIVDNHRLPMQQQKEILEKDFTNWKGTLEQVDDVCMIGIKV